MRKLKLFAICLFSALSMTACADVQIFEDKSETPAYTEYKKEELQEDVFYVKDGTSFYQLYECSTNSTATGLDETKVCWIMEDEEESIPTYYKGELIAKSSSKQVTKDAVAADRFYDCGYSIGLYGCSYTEDGYLYVQTKNLKTTDSSVYEALKNAKSNFILIETINDELVTPTMINEAGVILGMEEGKDYKLTYYAGSYYGEATVTADTHFFSSFEIYRIDSLNMTKNGYLSYEMSDDAKSGYYRINTGMYRYVNKEKGNTELVSENYNESYYGSEEEQLMVFSQQYSFDLSNTTTDMSIVAYFDPNSVTNTTGVVKMMATSPDGTKITVDAYKDSGEVSCDLTEAMPGVWTVNILPQDISLSDIKVISNAPEVEATNEVINFSIEEGLTGAIVEMDYIGEGEFAAQIVETSTGKSYTMEAQKKENGAEETTLLYEFSYLPAGEYKVNVYHYADTQISYFNCYLKEQIGDTDIIETEG